MATVLGSHFFHWHPYHSHACIDWGRKRESPCAIRRENYTDGNPTSDHHTAGADQLWAPREGSLKQLNLDRGLWRARWPGRRWKQQSRKAGEGAWELQHGGWRCAMCLSSAP